MKETNGNDFSDIIVVVKWTYGYKMTTTVQLYLH